MNGQHVEENGQKSIAEGFPPIDSGVSHTLILGSMPGIASLQRHEYYAHPRNAFWPIMMALLTDCELSYHRVTTVTYSKRCSLLQQKGYAVWDVLSSCERPGSLDSNIRRHSEQANPLGLWLDQHAAVNLIAFNGKAAETLFKRHCAVPSNREIQTVLLPSSSPAMASLTLEQKYARWRKMLLD